MFKTLKTIIRRKPTPPWHPMPSELTSLRATKILPVYTALYENYCRLRDAILCHRSQKADDRCIEDDDALYLSLQDGITCDRTVGSPEAMLQNCSHFIRNRCLGGQWKSYIELEHELIQAKETIKNLQRSLADKNSMQSSHL